MKLSGNTWRKWCRRIHRDLSFFFTGILLIYLISGIVMNHRDSIDPHYSVERKVYRIDRSLPAQGEIDRNAVLELLVPLREEKNYTKHYFPKPGEMKVFLKGGSNLYVDIATGDAVYESVRRRPIIGSMTRLHYNPGKWWTWFSDIFAVGTILIVLTGLFMLKGKNGILGWGGVELVAGIAVPLLFLFFF